MPCAAAKIYRYIAELPRATFIDEATGEEYTRVPKVDEYNTSCKCCDCLAMEKQDHPVHPEYVMTKWQTDPQTGKRKKMNVLFTDHSVYKLFQCKAKGCCRTHGRDLCGGGGIWRKSFEEAHSGACPPTYQRPEQPPSAAPAAKVVKRRRGRSRESAEAAPEDGPKTKRQRSPATRTDRRPSDGDESAEPTAKKAKKTKTAAKGGQKKKTTKAKAEARSSDQNRRHSSRLRRESHSGSPSPPGSGETSARETTPQGVLKRFGW